MNKNLIEKLLLMLLWEEEKTKITTFQNETPANAPHTIWDYVIVRSYYSGVMYWKYMWKSIEWGIVLHKSRRLWYRQSKQWVSLSELSIYGIKKDSKVTEPVDIEIIDPTVCEILKCSKECIESIDKQPNYQPS